MSFKDISSDQDSLHLKGSQSTINKDTGTSGQPTHEDAIPCSSTHLHESLTANVQEAQRILQICNACRYCEGFCAVFPAMTQRLAFSEADVHYLANLCHNCGACLHACQYAPPHEFQVNVPQTMAKVRLETYSEHAWPRGFGRLYEKNGLVMSLLLAVGMSFFMVLAVALKGSLLHEPLQGDFYAVFSHELMITIFGLTFGFAVFALAKGAISYWRQIQPGAPTVRAAGETSSDVLSLKYLDGGHGKGCNEEDDRFTLWRRRFHHFTFYGFMLCFAATSTGTLYHYLLDWHAPYPFFSLPVLLGTAGGIGLLVGPAGLFYLHTRRDPQHGDSNQKTMDRGFIALLFLTSLTGLLLLLWRDTSFMALLLAIHLGTVLAFFLIMPYCKFAHGFYRSIALYKWSLEKRQD